MAGNNEDIATIEEMIKQIKIEYHFPKITDDQMKTFMKALGSNLMGESKMENVNMDTIFMFSGSFMEGAPFARNLKRSKDDKYAEMEFDMMFPMGTIVKGYEERIIQELEYATGFLWLKYIKEGMELELKNGKKIEDFLTEHDLQLYLDSNLFKTDSNLSTKPDLTLFEKFQEELQGPSNNIDSTMKLKEFAAGLKDIKKSQLNKAVATLGRCLTFLQRALEGLERFKAFIMDQFLSFEKQLENNTLKIHEVELEEFMNKIPLQNRGRDERNKLLFLHLTMMAFVNELIWVIGLLDKIITEEELENNIGVWKFSFLPLLSYPKVLLRSLTDFIVALLKLPRWFRENTFEDSNEFLQKFLIKCFYERLQVLNDTVKVFERCVRILGPRFNVVKSIAYDHVDNQPVNDKLDKMGLNVDRVPAIICREWPSIAKEFKTRDRQWPPIDTMNSILQTGCHIVPKPYDGIERNENLDWRWSFSQVEMRLVNERSDKMNAVYLLLKSLFYLFVKAVEHDEKTLPSYLAKTLMLWETERQPPKWWENTTTTQCVIHLLQQMKFHFQDGCLPHYFISSLNLLENISDELIMYGLAILESICHDPLPCILEVVDEIIKLDTSRQEKRNTKDLEDPPISVDNKDLSGLEDGVAKPEKKQIFGRDSSLKRIKEEAGSLPLVIAEFRETIKQREEKFKDIPEKHGCIELLKNVYSAEIPKIFPEDFEKSKRIEVDYKSVKGDIKFDLMFNSLKDELTSTCIFKIHFKGSTALGLSVDYKG